MKLNIQENAINLEELKKNLTNHYRDRYTVKMKGKYIIAVAKTKIVGANVIPLKDKIVITGGFPSLSVQLIFTLLFIALGVIIPMILYWFLLHKKMKEVEQEVAGFIKKEYSQIIINS